MTREWKPGDLAMVTYRCGQCVETNLCAKTDKGWDCLAPGVGFLMHGDVIEARPLVVIDPEDETQVDSLCIALVEAMYRAGSVASAANGVYPGTVADALREFANPTPPKPEEPTGLGAVVEDDEGRKWVRATVDGRQGAPWTLRTLMGSLTDDWSHVNAVRILSPGVTP